MGARAGRGRRCAEVTRMVVWGGKGEGGSGAHAHARVGQTAKLQLLHPVHLRLRGVTGTV